MKKKTDRIRSYMVIALMLVFSMTALIDSLMIYQDRPGLADAGMYPLLMSSLMVFCLLMALLETKKLFPKKGEENDVEEGSSILAALKAEFPPRTLFLGGCILGYGILFKFIGFYISTAIFLMVTMLGLYKGKKVKMCVGVTAGALVAVYVIIEKIFNIPLP